MTSMTMRVVFLNLS